MLDHATSEIAIGSKFGIDATKKLRGEGFERPWPPLIKMNAAVKAKVEKIFCFHTDWEDILTSISELRKICRIV